MPGPVNESSTSGATRTSTRPNRGVAAVRLGEEGVATAQVLAPAAAPPPAGDRERRGPHLVGGVVETPPRRGGRGRGRGRGGGRYQPVVELDDVNNNGREVLQEDGDRVEDEGDEHEEVEEDEDEQAVPAALHPAPAAVPPSAVPVPAQRRQVRQVAGLHGGEQVALADRLDPVVPGPHPGPVVEDAAGRNRIDMWGVWQCMLCE